MVKLQQIHSFLRAKPDPCIDLAFAQALPTADPESLGPMAQVLLDRRQTQGCLALIEQYHRLPEQTRQAVLLEAPELTRALRQAMSNHKGTGPANALHIIHQSASVRLAYLIPDLLRHGQDELKDEAANCLLEMAERTQDTGSESAPAGHMAVETAFVTSAVRDALRYFAQHQRKEVLLAMFNLPLPAISELLRSLAEMGDDWTRPTGVMLTRSDTPAVRRALLAALAFESLQPFALDGIGLAVETGPLTEALSRWHLLKLNPIRNAIAKIKHTERFVPGMSAFVKLDRPGDTLGLVAWLDALPIEPHNMTRRLGQLSKAPDPATRLLALRRLIAIADQVDDATQANHAIAGYCSDSEPGIVRVAVTHLIRRGYSDITRVLAQLINSPDVRVQQIATKRLTPVAFSKLWESWPRLDSEHRLAAGRALIKIDPTFHAALHDKLCLPDPLAKTRALSIITELNQGLLLQDLILRLSRDDDPRVVASAIKALGAADPQRVLPTIEAALEHEDERIRANAVEALAQLDTGKHAERLVSLTEEQEPNRARANAIQALMQMNAGQALQALSHMLSDPRAEHRASALWLVEAMGIAEVARDVAEMSITESDPTIRERAGRVVQNLIELMSQPLPIQLLVGQPGVDEPTQTPEDHAAAG